MELKLYHYWRSSSSWRVRWALEIKGAQWQSAPINLLEKEQKSPEHLARNPLGVVPVLEIQENGETRYLGESAAIIDYIEKTFDGPSLFPADAFEAAQARQLGEVINAGTQPLQNLRVQQIIAGEYKDKVLKAGSPEDKAPWSIYWVRNGLQAYEALVQKTAGKYSIGDQLSYADLNLIPQCYNARRFDIDLEEYPTLFSIHQNCSQTDSFRASHPDRFA